MPRSFSVRLDGRTEERLDAIVRILGERGPEPSPSAAVRHAIDRLYETLVDDAGGSGSRDEGSGA
jgi:hypothetical protein